jgi:hypothetical protein
LVEETGVADNYKLNIVSYFNYVLAIFRRITTEVVSSNPVHGEVYSIKNYNFITDKTENHQE